MQFELAKGFDPEKNKELVDVNEHFYFNPTRFNFIKNHKSFRPGCLHVLLGTTGAGKTTLCRTLFRDISENKKILWYSTEETKDQFQTQNAYGSFTDYSNIKFVTESDILERLDRKTDDIEGFIKQLHWAIEESKPDIIFFDNITTSLFYDQNKKAPELVQRIRAMIRHHNFPMFLVAHTASQIKENTWFSAADMRGVRNIAVTAEYLYCLMRFRIESNGESTLGSFIHVDKSRLHDGGKEIYRLNYDPMTKSITGDVPISYDRFREFTKKLSEKK